MTEADFRQMLHDRGLVLDDKAFAAALAGARHLQAEVARVARYLKDLHEPR